MIKEALDTSEKFNIKQKAGYLATMVPESSDWLKATPSSSSSSTFIPNTAFEYACRYRLGLPSHDIDTEDCCLCSKKEAVKNDSWHYLSCMMALGGNKITVRHHGIRNVLANYATKAGAVVETEPLHCFAGTTLKRPDLEVIMDGKRYFIDVTVVSPSNPSNVNYGQVLLGAAVNKKRKVKTSQVWKGVKRCGRCVYSICY
jgi:hypothetical protein